jgi:hypothetical protein
MSTSSVGSNTPSLVSFLPPRSSEFID